MITKLNFQQQLLHSSESQEPLEILIGYLMIKFLGVLARSAESYCKL